MALVTLQQALDYLKETEDRDDVVQTIIDGLSAEFEARCNRTFASASYTERHDGRGKDYVLVNNSPIVSVTSVHESNSVPAVFDSTTLIEADYYVPYLDEGKVQLLGGRLFARGHQNVQVVYEGGWAEVPKDVQLAVLRWAGYVWKEEDTGRWLLQGRSFEGQQAQFRIPTEVPEEVMTVIRLYRQPSTG